MLAILASIGIAASMLAVWVHETVLDTENFVEAVGPAIESEAVQAVTADYVATQLIDALALEERVEAALAGIDDRLADGLAEALDLSGDELERLQRLDLDLTVLAGPISSGLESRIRDAVTSFVTNPRTAAAILDVAAAAHEKTVLLLRDELDQLPNLVVEEGEVRLNVVPVLAEALRALAPQGITIVGVDIDVPRIPATAEPADAVALLATAIGAELPNDFGQVAVMSEDRLRSLQDLITMLDRVVWALVIVTIGLAVAAIATAPSLGAGAIRVAVGGAVGVIVGLLLIQALAAWVAEAVQSPTAQLALEEVVTALVDSLRSVAILLAFIGFGAAAVAYAATHRPAPAEVDAG